MRAARAALPLAAALAGLLLVGAPLAAQSGTIQGRVHGPDGAAIQGARVALAAPDAPGAESRAVGTGPLGTFRFDAPAGRHVVVVTALGHAEARLEVMLSAGATVELVVELVPRAIEVEGLAVEAERSRERQRFEEVAGATVREMELAELRVVPGVAEVDPVRAVEVLPGVVSTSDFSAAFHVRGGSQDQNLILLDGFPIFSPFHLGGLFSVFNADMIERVELQSGGFPARHGGRVSSVLLIESDPGGGDLSVDAGVSLLAARVAVGGAAPDGLARALGQSTLRWRASARRSYFDAVLAPILDFPYHLRDLQGVLEGWTPGGDRIRLVAYGGRDVLDLTRLDDEDFPLRIDWSWGNDLVGLRWTRLRPGGGSVDLRAGASRFLTGLSFPDFSDTRFRSRIGQAQLGATLAARPSEGWRLEAGAAAERMTYHNLFRTGGTDFASGAGSGWLLGGHAQATWSQPRAWLVEAGVRVDGWRPEPGEPVLEPAPRAAVKRFFADGDLALKVAAGRYTQFLHSLRDEEIPLGLDVWVLAGDRSPHLVSDQAQVGVEAYFGPGWFASLEGYVRTFDGVAAFNPADDPNEDTDDILRGHGRSWGADLLLRRDRGTVTGWLALSWLRARRTFPDPLAPARAVPEVTYPPVFDRRIDVDLVLRWPAPWGWEGGVRWNFGTGTPYTRAVGAYAYYTPRLVDDRGLLRREGGDSDDPFSGGLAVQLGPRNGARYPVYHRLDLSFRRTYRRSWGVLVPYVNLVNVYNRRNVLFYFYEYDRSPPTRSGISMFPVLPTFGVEVRF